MSHSGRERFGDTIGRHPFGVLLVALFLMLALAPCTSLLTNLMPDFRGIAAIAPLSLLVTVASLLALWKGARHHASHMVAGAALILLLTFGSLITHHAMALAQIVAQILFLGYVLIVVERAVFHSREVTSDILCGAVCVYLLFGVLAGFIFVLIEYLAPGSFLISNLGANPIQEQNLFIHDPGWLLYFSFVTLTTVGYGDVLPANAVARSAAVLVAVIGQILLMVQIARLVGLHVARGSDSTNDSTK
ncbi:MAG: ion channel [Verrucomicrobiae bacterium]